MQISFFSRNRFFRIVIGLYLSNLSIKKCDEIQTTFIYWKVLRYDKEALAVMETRLKLSCVRNILEDYKDYWF